jgi:transposase
MQQSLTVVRARDVLIRLRTASVNAVRGLAKPCGCRLPSCATKYFHRRCLAALPEGLLPALKPLLEQIEHMTAQIQLYDRLILEMTKTSYPETQALLKVNGVGPLTALTFMLTLGEKRRFGNSRDVACYLGLQPRRNQSGDRDPQLVGRPGD